MGGEGGGWDGWADSSPFGANMPQLLPMLNVPMRKVVSTKQFIRGIPSHCTCEAQGSGLPERSADWKAMGSRRGIAHIRAFWASADSSSLLNARHAQQCMVHACLAIILSVIKCLAAYLLVPSCQRAALPPTC